MNETVFDKEMKDMLHRCADELHAPDKLKTRVDFALKNGSSRPRRRWGRRLIALAAVAAITVTGAFAAGAFGSITSHSWSDQRLSMEQTQQHMEDAGAALTLPETIGDFTFSHGYDVAATAKSATGKSEQVDEVNAEYEKDGVTLNFNAHKTYTVFSDEENIDRNTAENRRRQTRGNEKGRLFDRAAEDRDAGGRRGGAVRPCIVRSARAGGRRTDEHGSRRGAEQHGGASRRARHGA